MPKTIELTVEIVVQRVSCPGVWLCQDGSVSLIVSSLGTNYETCTLPPTFPLDFKDRLYFRKRFQETCALSNICCLLKDETLYCELVQWSQNCDSGECNILAQYLGSLSDVLFPPKTCCSDGVDLLMRRSKKYPGILSPKIEIATKVRIDEVWDNNTEHLNANIQTVKNIVDCNCMPRAGPRHSRQKTVCHTPEYHRNKCHTSIPGTKCRTRSRSRSGGSGSTVCRSQEKFRCAYSESKPRAANSEDKKIVLESRYVDVDERHTREYEDIQTTSHTKAYDESKFCVCEICKRYHELFHADSDIQVS
ncbi:spermatogenesis-associated protein 6 isoform X2 [Cydia fagiglandana]|uniref:spermatogenesis-associated protein 6 isoform X2 n=1 Tax=Cydia fagiglandana TaxID=1458189 RepID=UPI002FEE32A3